MTYRLTFTDGKGEKVVMKGLSRKTATTLINRAILDCGYSDAKVTKEKSQ
jgi:hypothetical protein